MADTLWAVNVDEVRDRTTTRPGRMVAGREGPSIDLKATKKYSGDSPREQLIEAEEALGSD